MTENIPKIESAEKIEKAEAVENGEGKPEVEKAIYIRTSKVRSLFIKKEGTEAIKIRISGDALDEVMKFLDNKVKEGVNELIAKLPTISKGENKGKLKRQTIKMCDLTGKPDKEDSDTE